MRVYSENGERPVILARVEKLGFVTFTNKDYDLNIIGERNPNGEADQFDDWLHVLYKERGIWQWHAYQCTTDAGMYYLKNTVGVQERLFFAILNKCGAPIS